MPVRLPRGGLPEFTNEVQHVTGGVSMGQTYKQLSLEDDCAAFGRQVGSANRGSLDHGPSIISRELNRNAGVRLPGQLWAGRDERSAGALSPRMEARPVPRGIGAPWPRLVARTRAGRARPHLALLSGDAICRAPRVSAACATRGMAVGKLIQGTCFSG